MFIDFHNDTVLKLIYNNCDFIKGSPDLQVDLPKIRACKGLAGLFFAACCDPIFKGDAAVQNAAKMIRVIRETLARCEKDVRIVHSKEEFDSATKSGRVAAFLAIEGGYAINDSLVNLERFYKEGVRLMTLTHSKSTAWAGSAHEKEKKGLSAFGREVIREMDGLGMIIDVAHVCDETVFDVVKASKRPVVCSHGSAKGAYDGLRSLSDDVIKAIALTGGVIGVIFFPDFLTCNPEVDQKKVAGLFTQMGRIEADESLSMEEKARESYSFYFNGIEVPKEIPGAVEIFRHIDYIVNLVGEDHAAIGSDYDGAPYFCRGVKDVSKLSNMADIMKAHGYSDARIEKIMAGNILRVMACSGRL